MQSNLLSKCYLKSYYVQFFSLSNLKIWSWKGYLFVTDLNLWFVEIEVKEHFYFKFCILWRFKLLNKLRFKYVISSWCFVKIFYKSKRIIVAVIEKNIVVLLTVFLNIFFSPFDNLFNWLTSEPKWNYEVIDIFIT